MFHRDLRSLTGFIGDEKARSRSRRAFLRDLALAALAGVASPLQAQRAHGIGIVDPPARLADFTLIDQNGATRQLDDLLLQKVTAVQTIYTGCGSVCPLQGALFSAVQDRIPAMHGARPVRLLSIGIDPLSDSPSALRHWLAQFSAGPAWNAATPGLKDVDRVRQALSGSTLPLGNIAAHSTQIYCFDGHGMLRYRSSDLPRVEEICDVIGKLVRL
jgi:protein SCO1